MRQERHFQDAVSGTVARVIGHALSAPPRSASAHNLPRVGRNDPKRSGTVAGLGWATPQNDGIAETWSAVDASACPEAAPASRRTCESVRMRVLGIDLAWAEGTMTKAANESGVAAVERSGTVLDAGWTLGLDATLAWVDAWATDDTLLLVDAPLIVTNPAGQRPCERDVGRYYGKWKVSANSTNLASPRLAGVKLRERLEDRVGVTTTDVMARQPSDVSSRSAIRTRRSSAPKNSGSTSSGRNTSADRSS